LKKQINFDFSSRFLRLAVKNKIGDQRPLKKLAEKKLLILIIAVRYGCKKTKVKDNKTK